MKIRPVGVVFQADGYGEGNSQFRNYVKLCKNTAHQAIRPPLTLTEHKKAIS
jgi:hypothetical protein